MRFSIILWFTLYSHSSAIFNYYEITGANRSLIGSVKPSPLLVIRNGKTFEPAQPIGYTNGTYQFDKELHEIYYACGINDRNIFLKFKKAQKDSFCSQNLIYDEFKGVEEDPTHNISYRVKGMLYEDETIFVTLISVYHNRYAVKYKLRGKYLFDIVNRSALREPSLEKPFVIIKGTAKILFSQNIPQPRLMKAQLVPADNYLTPAERRATYHVRNLAPIWNLMYQKWLNIENFIRKVSYVLGELEIITGMNSIFKAQKRSILIEDIRTYDNGVVPQYYAKAVIHEPSNTAIIVVFDMSDDKNEERLCDPDISLKNGWFVTNNDDTGSIYACEYNKKSLRPWKDVLPKHYNILNLNQVRYEVVNEAGEITKYERNVVEEILNNFY